MHGRTCPVTGTMGGDGASVPDQATSEPSFWGKWECQERDQRDRNRREKKSSPPELPETDILHSVAHARKEVMEKQSSGGGCHSSYQLFLLWDLLPGSPSGCPENLGGLWDGSTQRTHGVKVLKASL